MGGTTPAQGANLLLMRTATPAAGGACTKLCTDASFSSGTESKFDKNLTECQCAGTGGPVTQASCEAYCAPLGIPASKALLSGNNKCVCDGTSL